MTCVYTFLAGHKHSQTFQHDETNSLRSSAALVPALSSLWVIIALIVSYSVCGMHVVHDKQPWCTSAVGCAACADQCENVLLDSRAGPFGVWSIWSSATSRASATNLNIDRKMVIIMDVLWARVFCQIVTTTRVHISIHLRLNCREARNNSALKRRGTEKGEYHWQLAGVPRWHKGGAIIL